MNALFINFKSSIHESGISPLDFPGNLNLLYKVYFLRYDFHFLNTGKGLSL